MLVKCTILQEPVNQFTNLKHALCNQVSKLPWMPIPKCVPWLGMACDIRSPEEESMSINFQEPEMFDTGIQGQQSNTEVESLHPRLAWMMCYKRTGNVQTVCRKFSISRKTFYKWHKRFIASREDSSSLLDQSRRPHRFPRATPEENIHLLMRLRSETGFGQRRLRVMLQSRYNINISERTIWKIIKRVERGS